MLYSVRGKLIAIESNAAVVECGGVGYMCQTTMNTLKAVKLNTEVTLYTYLNVREDAVDLFGFATKAELETFKNLISVSGVGPKAGLAVLSELSPEQVAMAIASDDLKTITRAQGIGKKIAQRIVLELKDKLFCTGGTEQRECFNGKCSESNRGTRSFGLFSVGCFTRARNTRQCLAC